MPVMSGPVDERTGQVGQTYVPGVGVVSTDPSSMLAANQSVPTAFSSGQAPPSGDPAANFGTDSGGFAPMTGFASKYTPAMGDQAYENPWYILPDVFPGISTSSPMYQALRDLGADPLTLFNIIAGSQQKIDQGASPYINWLQEMYQQQGTRGGQDFNANQLIKMLFGQTKFGADSQNTLGQILGAGDMSTQVRTLFNMLRDVSNVGMNPLAARGYQAAVAQAGDRYGNAQMKADAESTTNPTEWIRKNMPWLAAQ